MYKIVETALGNRSFNWETIIFQHVIGILRQVYRDQHLVSSLGGGRQLAGLDIPPLFQQIFLLDVTKDKYAPALICLRIVDPLSSELCHMVRSAGSQTAQAQGYLIFPLFENPEHRFAGEALIEAFKIIGVQYFLGIYAVFNTKVAPLRNTAPDQVLLTVDIIIPGKVYDNTFVKHGDKALGVHLLYLVKPLLLLKIRLMRRDGDHDSADIAVP